MILVEATCRLVGNTSELNTLIARNEDNGVEAFTLVDRIKFTQVLKLIKSREKSFKKNIRRDFNYDDDMHLAIYQKNEQNNKRAFKNKNKKKGVRFEKKKLFKEIDAKSKLKIHAIETS